MVLGLFMYSNFESNNILIKLKKDILITIVYSFIIGEFIQMYYPTSEINSVISGLVFDLKNNYLIIIGLSTSLIKYSYKLIVNKSKENE